jgi:predicted unusual protein kinase regulating ubiquinone biosynthesis (AarF/ABC1/UbiB family)
LRRNTVSRRAARLRRIFEGLGPTFVKVGQQLSVRSDLLGFEYCRELASMLDEVSPFPVRRAIRVIEKSTGRPLADSFREFNPRPIGSASLSCVYKARLHAGDWVAVKVRRPGVVAMLAADIRALSWLLQLGEWLSLFKPGFTSNLRSELGGMLFEEIDFVREARNAEIFRREAERHEQHHLSAPRVYFDLSSEDVLVAEFVTGTFLNEIMHALDTGDHAALAEIRGRGIDIAQVARNLVMAAHWELLESILFHADPHPANICVQPGNVLVFVDFGSCGRLTGRYRRIWERFYQALERHDVQDMVSCAVSILEPLPHLDADGFAREIELMFWDWVYAMNSEHAAWWEKASGLLWLRFAGIAHRYQAYMSSEIVRIFRATFIYDTTIFRLSVTLDMRDEFRRYYRQAGKRAKRRVRRAFWSRIEHGLKNEDYVEIARVWHMGWQIQRRVQRFLDQPSPNFAREIGKLSYGVSLLLNVAATIAVGYVIAVVGSWIYRWITGHPVRAIGMLDPIAGAGIIELGVAVVLLILLRKAKAKFQEHDSD